MLCLLLELFELLFFCSQLFLVTKASYTSLQHCCLCLSDLMPPVPLPFGGAALLLPPIKKFKQKICLKTLKIVATADDHRVLHLGVAATSTTLPLPGAPSDDCCHWVGLLAGPRWPGSKRESETGECGF